MSPDPIKLKAFRDCGICRGHGEYYESHGPGLRELMVCECVFLDAPQDEETQQQIDAGNFSIVPDPQISEVWDYEHE